MTQQIINVGAVANDGTGESLRNAFNNVNNNFSSIWAAGPVDSQVVISNNMVTTNVTNLDLVLAGNGVGYITAKSTIAPSIDSVRDLGTANLRFNGVYAQYFYGNGAFLTGIASGNGGSTTTFSATAPVSPNVGDVWIQSTTGIQYIYFNDNNSSQWAEMEASVSFSGGGAGNGNVDLTQVGSDIIPAYTNAYNLGNASNQWQDLWVSNATIYMNSVPLTADGANLKYNGNTVLTTSTSLTFTNITATGNVVAGAVYSNAVYSNDYRYANGAPFPLGSNTIPGSTISIRDNVISTTVTNQNLTLWANGIGNIQTNSSLSPSIDGVYDIGSSVRRYDGIYARYFYGNGAFLTGISGGGNANTGNWAFTGNTMYNLNGGAINNSDLSHGATASLSIPDNGSVNAISVLNYYGNISLTSSTGPSNTASWIFDSKSNVRLPSGGVLGNTYGDNANAVGLQAGPGGYAIINSNDQKQYVQADDGNVYIGTDYPANNYLWTFDKNSNLHMPGPMTWATGENIYADGNLLILSGDASGNTKIDINAGANSVYVSADNQSWTFDYNGWLTVPGNKGLQGTINEDIVIKAQDHDNDDFSIRMEVVDNADDPQSRLEQRRDIFRIRLDMAVSDTTWQFDDTGRLVLPAAAAIWSSSSGNASIVAREVTDSSFVELLTQDNSDIRRSNITLTRDNINVTTSSGAYNWTFGVDGNLTVPGNIVGITANNSGSLQWIGNSSGDGYGYTTLQLRPDDTLTGDQWLIVDPTSPNHIHIRAGGTQDNSNSYLFLGGENSYFQVPAGSNPNVVVAANSNTWTFGADGTTIPPVLTTARGDTTSSTITGYTLRIGDGTQEGIITTLDGTESYPYAQRLVINPGKGQDGSSGEGGDIYLWAGRGGNGDGITGGGSGGDIKIRGGQGMSGGDGGYIRIEAGDSNNDTGQAGYVEIRGGQTAGGSTGYVNIQGGYNSSGTGGDVALISGYGSSDYGNVVINTTGGINLWTFDKDGQLHLPGGTGYIGSSANNISIYSDTAETNGMLFYDTGSEVYSVGDFKIFADNAGSGNTWNFAANAELQAPGAITTAGNISAGNFIGGGSNVDLIAATEQWTFSTNGNLTYPDGTITTGGAVYAAANASVQMISNNAYNQVRVDDSNVEIYTSPNGSTQYQWTFDNTGNLTAPGNITANTLVSNAFNVLTAGNLLITSQYGLGVTGTILEQDGTLELIGNGTGCVVVGWNSTYGTLGNVAQMHFSPAGNSGNIVVTTGNTAGTSYDWIFGNTGILFVPGEGVIRSLDDTVTLQSFNTGTGFANSVYVGTSGGLGFADASIGSNWLEIFRSGTDPQIATPGNLTIVTDSTNTAHTWDFDNTGNLTLPGNITGNTGGFAIGYRDIPQVTFSANATAALTDAGKHYYSTTAGNLALTLPDNSSVAFPTGAALTVVVNAAGNVLVNQGTGVSLYMAGSSTTGNRVVGAYGLASVMKVAANTWVISGTGVY